MNSKILFAFCIFILVASSLVQAADYTPEAEKDRVKKLPNGPKADFGLFAGNLTLNTATGKSFFYTFVEAAENPATAPWVLWLNGGPGCSSVANGFLSENGPFLVANNGKSLVTNDFSWNKFANILYLDSPSFVGFSYTPSPLSSDINANDNTTATENYNFLKKWLSRFPQLKGRPFFLAGEGYAGHYLPQLAIKIIDNNNDNTINLKGILVGNPSADPVFDGQGAVNYWYDRGLISLEIRDAMLATCDFNSFGFTGVNREVVVTAQQQALVPIAILPSPSPVSAPPPPPPAPPSSSTCSDLLALAQKQLGMLDVYDINGDYCFAGASAKGIDILDGGSTVVSKASNDQGVNPPCINYDALNYLSRPDVQSALHANISAAIPYQYQVCADSATFKYNTADQFKSMIPLYRSLLDLGVRTWIYSGDADAVLPLTGTRNWVRSMNYTIATPWRSWQSTTRQVGGWTESYNQVPLLYAIVRDAGQMTPLTQPERALYLFVKFLQGKPL